jgi:hypothetical protein
MCQESKLKLLLSNGLMLICVQFVSNHLVRREMLISIIGIYIIYLVVYVGYQYVDNVQERR